jgi:hypothetical protein
MTTPVIPAPIVPTLPQTLVVPNPSVSAPTATYIVWFAGGYIKADGIYRAGGP